jgi:hypothetical protein
MALVLKKYDKGRSNTPIRDSFYASIGLNPFLEPGRMLSKYEFQGEATSAVLASLKGIVNIVEISGDGYAFNSPGGEIYKSSGFGGSWSLLHTNGKNDGHQCAFTAPLYSDPTKTNIYFIAKEGSDSFVGTAPTPYADGDFVDSWKTITGGASKTIRASVIRDWVLFTNGQYLGGWKFSSTVDSFSTNLLDFKPGSVAIDVVGNKSGGVRNAYIAVQYSPDRELDGIYVWDLEQTSPIDFIPIPWLESIYAKGGKLYAIHGNKLNVSPVSSNGPVLNDPDISILGGTILRSSAPTARFLGSYLGLLLIGVSGARDNATFGWGYNPGLWVYNPKNGALFFWITPNTNETYNVIVNSVYVREDRELRASFTCTDGTNTVYYLQVLNKLNSGVTVKNLLLTPILGYDEEAIKSWKKISFNHNLLTLASLDPRIEIWRRDFRREPSVTTTPALVVITANTFKSATSSGNTVGIKVGDYVRVTGGTGSGQVRQIIGTSIDGLNTIYTVDRNWDVNPTTDSKIEWWPFIKMATLTATSEGLDRKSLPLDFEDVLAQFLFVITFSSQTGTIGVEIRNLTIDVALKK